MINRPLKLTGDIAAMFDGEVGNASGGIQFVRCKRICWAILHAEIAGTAMVGSGGIRFQVETAKDFANEKIGADFLINQHCVFADPAEPGLSGVAAFENRACINI